MRLGLSIGYSGAKMKLPLERVKRAEQLGYDCVWTAEAYGSDAVTVATWVLAQTEKIRVGTAIMQMPARTPAMTAMTAVNRTKHRHRDNLRYMLPPYRLFSRLRKSTIHN